jgi:hypothetical protein
MSIVRSQASASTSHSGPTGPLVPALLARRSMGPDDCSILSTACSTAWMSVTSAVSGMALAPALSSNLALSSTSSDVRARRAAEAPARRQ